MKIADLTEARKIVVPQVDTGGLTFADVKKVWAKEWRDGDVRPTEEDFRQEFILATMAGSYNEMHRGVLVPKNWIKTLRPGMPLGTFWTDDFATAGWFGAGGGSASYDDRFTRPENEDTISVILVGQAKLESIDLLNTIGARICWQMEGEICLKKGAPIKLLDILLHKGVGHSEHEDSWKSVLTRRLKGATFTA